MAVPTPVAEFLFSEGSGNAVSTTGGYTLVPAAGTSWDTGGKIKGPFSGPLGANSALTNWSISWTAIIGDDTGNAEFIGDTGDNQVLQRWSNEDTIVYYGGGGTNVQAANGTVLSPNTYEMCITHCGGTSAASTTRIYLNGVEVEYSPVGLKRYTGGTGNTMNFGGTTTLVGQSAGGANPMGPSPVRITMDNLRTWNICLTPAQVAELAGAPIPDVQLIATDFAVITASRSPSNTFVGYIPVANDLIIQWPSSTGITVTPTAPSGWTNPLGGTTDVESTAHELCSVWHQVTAAEESAVTTTYSPVNLYGATTTGAVIGVVLRGADPANPVDAVGTTFAGAVTPHVLASVSAASIDRSGGMVISSVAKDDIGAYTTAVSGWKFHATFNTNQGRALLVRDALSTAGVAVAATNVTPSAADDYASITLVINKAVAKAGNEQLTAAVRRAGFY